MDYFSELLSSYEKLKKRTFKLTYIAEDEKKKASPKKKKAEKKPKAEKKDGKANQEDINAASQQEAEKKAKEVAKAGVSQQYDNTKRVEGGPPWAFLSPAKGKEPARVSLTLGAGRPMALADEGGNPKIDSQGWKRLVSYYMEGGEEKQAADELAAEVEAERQAKLRTIGGWSELEDEEREAEGLPPLNTTEDTLQALRLSEKFANNYCIANKDTESLKDFCAKLWTYFAAGNSHMGLEYKLGTATGIAVTDVDTGETKKQVVSPGMREQAARSAAFLTSFLRSPGIKDENGVPEKCKDVTSRIGMFKGKSLVLFGQEPSEGIVVGEPNALQKLALKAIEKECGIDTGALSQLIGDTIGTKEKNAVKGTFFEAILVFSGKIRTATTPSAKIAAVEDLKKVLTEKKATLLAIFRDIDPQAGQSIDSEFDLSVQEQALAALNSPEELNDFVMRELRATQPLMDFMEADDMVHGGKVSKTGQRADIMFAYKGKNAKARAKAKAKATGSSVKDLGDGSYGVPMGLKRLQDLHGPKFGEINSQERLDGIITGRIRDSHIETGFEQSMRKKQFGGAGTARQQDMIEFADTLSEEVNTATQQLVENQTYIGEDGKIKSQTPAEVFGQLAKTILNTLSLNTLKTSVLGKALFNTNENGEQTKKDFDGDGPGPFENRERGREMIARVARNNKIKTEIEAGNQAARDYVIKAALVTGSNKDNMTQVIVDDAGRMIVFKHNEIFDMITKAESKRAEQIARGEEPDPDEPIFGFDESSTSIKVGNISVTVGQEMAKVNDEDGNFRSCTTRTDSRINKATLENTDLHGDISMPENSSVLHQYLTGQMALLETLLSQTKMNQVL